MSIAKAVVTGIVFRNPEKRFTKNQVAIYSLTLNIGESEETLIRVISKRKALEPFLDTVRQGDKILVDGRLQIATSKYTDGSEKRFYEIDASNIELMQSENQTPTGNSETLIEIPEESDIDEEEIPF
jgi:single-stranded DNA-binding protein